MSLEKIATLQLNSVGLTVLSLGLHAGWSVGACCLLRCNIYCRPCKVIAVVVVIINSSSSSNSSSSAVVSETRPNVSRILSRKVVRGQRQQARAQSQQQVGAARVFKSGFVFLKLFWQLGDGG
jgi:hypothetical protein